MVELIIARISEEGLIVSGEEPYAILELEGDENVKAQSPVRYNLKAQAVTGELVVRGVVDVDVLFRCVRCAEFFPFHVSEPAFQAVYKFADKTESVELTPDIREAMILAFPAYPVCDEGCKGLCSQCGTNLNKGRCSCTTTRDKRWRALDGFNMG